jgi:hypothetical protein
MWMAEKLNIDLSILTDSEQLAQNLGAAAEMFQTAQMQSLGLPAGVPGAPIPGTV